MNKKLIMIVAPDFRDEEYVKPREIFDQAGIHVTVASIRKGVCRAVGGTEIAVEKTLAEANSADYHGIVFVGGPGTMKLFQDENALRLAKEFFESGKMVAAICIAPVILASAGILAGKKATVFAKGSQTLEEKGARYTGTSCEVDGQIVTADGPASAQEFGQAIVKTLE